MTLTAPVPIRAGHLVGEVFWDTDLQTFAAALKLFDPREERVSYPPSEVRIGGRFAEFVTTDALVNQLAAIGLPPGAVAIGSVHHFGEAVGSIVGEAEFVGLTGTVGSPSEETDDEPTRRLFLRTPDGSSTELLPRLDHPDYRHQWGSTGPRVVETARLLCEVAFVRRSGLDLETFALALTYEFLAELDDDFSVSANAVCDWYLTDSEPSTTLDLATLDEVRAEVW